MKRTCLAVLTALITPPKPLKRPNPVTARNTGLKSGVTETVGNYMRMARELNCDMFATA